MNGRWPISRGDWRVSDMGKDIKHVNYYFIVANCGIAFDVELKKATRHSFRLINLLLFLLLPLFVGSALQISVCVSAHLLSGGIVWASDSVFNVSGSAPLDPPTSDMYEGLFRRRIRPRRQKRKKTAKLLSVSSIKYLCVAQNYLWLFLMFAYASHSIRSTLTCMWAMAI